jgi:hypothetical protein
VDRRVELEQHLSLLNEAISVALNGEKGAVGAVAGLVRERRLTLNELAAVQPAGKSRDEVAAKRSARRAAVAAVAEASS